MHSESASLVADVLDVVESYDSPKLVAARQQLRQRRSATIEYRPKWGASSPKAFHLYRCLSLSCDSYGVGSSKKTDRYWRCLDCGAKNSLERSTILETA